MRLKSLLRALSWLGYPLLILFGVRVAEPRYVAVMLAAVLLFRRSGEAARLMAGLSVFDRAVLAGLIGLAGAVALTNSEWLLRFYPAAMNSGFLLIFAVSLVRPPSMVERFARLREPQLPPRAIPYTRRVTQWWCVFFVVNGAVALYTAIWASRELWALYNGFIAYLLMAALFGGEWLYRRFLLTGRRP